MGNARLESLCWANSKCVITGIDVEVKPGHRAITSDGITLGLDTVADAERILQLRIKVDSESVEAPEGNWDAMISVSPTSNVPFKTIYRALLKKDAADRMSHDPAFDDFRNLPMKRETAPDNGSSRRLEKAIGGGRPRSLF